jgi:type II secretory pathway component GspD/PulD (secretin)
VTLPRPPSGLTGAGLQGFEDQGGGAGGAGDPAAGQITFPWQRGAGQNQERSPESALIGKIRIVPIVRRNALAIISPVSYQNPVVDLISDFDKPGRQVRVRAIIAEVELTDALALGLRVSNTDITSSLIDNRIGGSATGASASIKHLRQPQADAGEVVEQDQGDDLDAHERQHAGEDLVQGHVRRRHTLQVEGGHRDRR